MLGHKNRMRNRNYATLRMPRNIGERFCCHKLLLSTLRACWNRSGIMRIRWVTGSGKLLETGLIGLSQRKAICGLGKGGVNLNLGDHHYTLTET